MKQPRGIRNNNPLNIRRGSNWKGERPHATDPQFEEFETISFGIRAALILMRNHITGFKGTRPKANTLTKLIHVWAPPTENATNKYIDFVAASARISPTDILDEKNMNLMCSIARAMAFVECGVWIDIQHFQTAWCMM